jgi:hypothetical protein
MESKLTLKGQKLLSNVIISFFSIVALVFFLLATERTAVVTVISIIMLLISLFLLWGQQEFDSVSLLIFFFGTTACFYFFSDVILESWPRILAIAIFAILSLVLTNYLLNPVSASPSADKALYKVALAIVFTELFWVLSFFKASQISKGAITAVIFFNLLVMGRDILTKKVQFGKFAFLISVSIILLAVVIYRI